MSYDYSDRFSNWQSGGAAVATVEPTPASAPAATETADITLEFLFSKDMDDWSEEELINIISELAPDVTPSSFELDSLWNLAVGLAGQGVEENSTNNSYIYFAYQCIEQPYHWAWDDDSPTLPQSRMASLLISTLTA
jgi:hypothetical protein